MLNNISITELKFPNLGLGYYAIVIAFLLLLLYKGQEKFGKKDKYERILFTTLLSIFLFLLICIAITDIDLFKDAMLYKIGLPKFLAGFFNLIAIYRNIIIVIIIIGFLFSILLYLFLDLYQKNIFKKSKKIFIGLLVLAVILEIFDFGAHYVTNQKNERMNKAFGRNFNLLVRESKKYKNLIVVNRDYLPPYTSGTKKDLLDFATYHNLKTNIGLYARNLSKENEIIHYNESDDNINYQFSNDTIYVFENPCMMGAMNYNLTYYRLNNYLVGVAEPFDEIEVIDDTVKNFKMTEKTKPIKVKLDPIKDLPTYLKNNNRHDFEYIDTGWKEDGKTHKTIERKCKYCGYSDTVLDDGLGHIFGEYIDDDNASIFSHRTKTATCVCGAKDTILNDEGILGHKFVRRIVQYPTNELPGIQMLICTECNKKLGGTEKYAYAEIEYEEVEYDGKEHTPKVNVKDENGVEVDESNYIVSYVSNTQVGEAKAMVTYVDSKDTNNFRFNMYFYILPLGTELTGAQYDNDGTLNVSWIKPDTRYDGYEIEYSANEIFDEESKKTYEVIRKNSTDTKIDNVDRDYKYVRIRTYRNLGGDRDRIYSKWSDVVEIN